MNLLKKASQSIVLKYCLALMLLYFALSKVDTSKVMGNLKQIPLLNIVIAFIMLNASQLISAVRMKKYLQHNGWNITDKKYTVMLYYVGMFYNNILPGGIGGDGYKMLIIAQKFSAKATSVLRVLICERLNGLAGLCLLLLISAACMEVSPQLSTIMPLAIFALIACIPVYVIAAKIIFKDRPEISLKILPLSIVIQLLSCLSACSIVTALGVQIASITAYIALFLLAGLLSAVLPISVGGVGVREYVFTHGAQILPVSAETGVAFAIAYFAVYFISSLIGIAFIGKIKIGVEDVTKS